MAEVGIAGAEGTEVDAFLCANVSDWLVAVTGDVALLCGLTGFVCADFVEPDSLLSINTRPTSARSATTNSPPIIKVLIMYSFVCVVRRFFAYVRVTLWNTSAINRWTTDNVMPLITLMQANGSLCTHAGNEVFALVPITQDSFNYFVDNTKS